MKYPDELVAMIANKSHEVCAKFYSSKFDNALQVHMEIAQAALSVAGEYYETKIEKQKAALVIARQIIIDDLGTEIAEIEEALND